LRTPAHDLRQLANDIAARVNVIRTPANDIPARGNVIQSRGQSQERVVYRKFSGRYNFRPMWRSPP
jgi:hypothetical protein